MDICKRSTAAMIRRKFLLFLFIIFNITAHLTTSSKINMENNVETIVIPNPKPVPKHKKSVYILKEYIPITTKETCKKYGLGKQHCFAILQLLLLTYVTPDEENSNYLYMYYNNTVFFPKESIQYVTPKLTKENSAVNVSFNILYNSTSRYGNLFLTPNNCVSQTLLNPPPAEVNATICIADFQLMSDLNYNLDPRIIKEVCRVLDKTDKCFELEKSVHNFLQDKQHSHDLLLYVNVMNYVKQTINDDRIKLAKPIKCQDCIMTVKPNENPYEVTDSFCKKYSFSSSQCDQILTSTTSLFAAKVRSRLLRCNGIGFMKHNDLKMKQPSLKLILDSMTIESNSKKIKPDSGNNAIVAIQPTLNIWIPVFDKENFLKIDEYSSIVYQKPIKMKNSVFNIKNIKDENIKKATNNLYFGYMTIIRHPISKIYMLYYRSADTVRNFNVVANEVTGLLKSIDGISFEPVKSKVIANIETHMILYNTHNFSPVVDPSECIPGQQDFFSYRTDNQSYLPNPKLRRQFPSVKPFTFKAINGRDYSSSSDQCGANGIRTLYSDDGIEWIPSIGKPILTWEHAAKAGFNGAYYDSLNSLYYDVKYKKYRIFARHNPMQGIRDMQMFESLTQCNWREYSTPGIPVSYFSIIHDDLTLYVPGVTSIPGTDYIGFLPTVTLSHHENCPTFVSFMYSNDGGRIMHNNIGSIIDPEKKNLFDNCRFNGQANDIYKEFQEFGVQNIVESMDCKYFYVYTYGEDENVKRGNHMWRPSVIHGYKYRYGGIAAIETVDFGSSSKRVVTSTIHTKSIQIPLGAKYLLLNYEVSDAEGYIQAGFQKDSNETCKADDDILIHYSWEKSCKMSGTYLSNQVCWYNHDNRETVNKKLSIEKLAGLKLKLIFKLRKARLFAYMFASSEEEYANEVKRHGFFCYHRFVEKY